jgi:recombinational DNA repair protein (RecF pathway)
MKGFIVAIRRAGNEDLIVTVLGERYMRSYYRFYGVRHSILQMGYMIDFEEEEENRFMPRLRKVSHIGFPWLYRRNRLMHWQNFIRLFEPHLRDTETLEPFYYELLLSSAKRWDRQNPRRIICEAAHALLKYEGRLHNPDICYICERPLEDSVSLMTALLPAHPECIYGPSLPKNSMVEFMESGRTTLMDDMEVEYLSQIILKGL